MGKHFIFNSYHIFWQLVPREIFHILVIMIYDVCQFSSINCFFEDPHLDRGGKLLKVRDIITNDFCNSWPPTKSNHGKRKMLLNSTEQKIKSMNVIHVHMYITECNVIHVLILIPITVSPGYDKTLVKPSGSWLLTSFWLINRPEIKKNSGSSVRQRGNILETSDSQPIWKRVLEAEVKPILKRKARLFSWEI